MGEGQGNGANARYVCTIPRGTPHPYHVRLIPPSRVAPSLRLFAISTLLLVSALLVVPPRCSSLLSLLAVAISITLVLISALPLLFVSALLLVLDICG